MQIAGFSSAYQFASPLSASVPRPNESASSPDLARASFAPVAAGSETDSANAATSQEEQDKQPEASAPTKPGEPRTAQEEQKLQLVVAELANRDREVRTHEQAHAAVGGVHAGAPTYTYTQGPDGKRYASGGEVSIDVGAVANDPQATLTKMQIVIRAALAPAEPSAQDRSVASQAQAQMAVARAELAAMQRSEGSEGEATQAPADEDAEKSDDPSVTADASTSPPVPAGISLYAASADQQRPSGLLDLRA
ncbi:putative metalloprotease CJM1_0395 family protein [Pseudomonas sp. G34]|uniref:putative metalloprotease CJM1_0395 family protein n=1 Tax=Pseudomonas sp. G34 TaxID=3059083 RepID=UPI002809ACC8|nr:putative metalloprotease CJM1_0395 family protein [Pseudomonas sp. G34]MDQ7983368.1 putative metalloprotease CJM1_0395 family protein [Pseudomonas sp. G34]